MMTTDRCDGGEAAMGGALSRPAATGFELRPVD